MKGKKGRTNLLRQYADYCSHCPHLDDYSGSKQKFHEGLIWCAHYQMDMDSKKLSKSHVFCTLGKEIHKPEPSPSLNNTYTVARLYPQYGEDGYTGEIL
jgi:hypothetical protein